MLQDATHIVVQRSIQLELELHSVRNSLCLEISDAANRELLLHRAQSQLEMEREFGMKAMAEAVSLLTKVQHLGQELVITRNELSKTKVGSHLAEIGLFGILCLLIMLAYRLLDTSGHLYLFCVSARWQSNAACCLSCCTIMHLLVCSNQVPLILYE
jgi:hypothetical protein